MNLYKYHNEPTQLLQYDNVIEDAKQLDIDEFWKDVGEPTKIGRGEEEIAKSASNSWVYASEILKDRFLLGEPVMRGSRVWHHYVYSMKKLGIEL